MRFVEYVMIAVFWLVVFWILFAFGLAGPGTFITSTTVAWSIVTAMFAFGLFSRRRPDDHRLSRRDVFFAFVCVGIFAGIGIVVRVLTGPATPIDIALMLLNEHEEYLGGRLQIIGYGIAAYTLGCLLHDMKK
jgi:amino acid transporter